MQNGRTPAIIFSLPQNESKLISIAQNTATNMVQPSSSVLAVLTQAYQQSHSTLTTLQVRVHGRMGLAAQRYVVKIGDEDLPVLVSKKHVTC